MELSCEESCCSAGNNQAAEQAGITQHSWQLSSNGAVGLRRAVEQIDIDDRLVVGHILAQELRGAQALDRMSGGPLMHHARTAVDYVAICAVAIDHDASHLCVLLGFDLGHRDRIRRFDDVAFSERNLNSVD